MSKRDIIFNRSDPPSRESVYFWKWSCCTRIGTYFKLFIVLLRCSGRSSRILTAQAFPQAEELRVIPLENLAAFIEITADDYGIVITRGHNFDFIVAKQLLKHQPNILV